MPDEQGRLSREELKTVVAKFREWETTKLGGDLVCEMCHGKFWIPHVCLLGLTSDRTNPLEPHYRLPSVAFICRDCGNIKTFYAELMGISPLQKTTQEKDETPPGQEVKNGG